MIAPPSWSPRWTLGPLLLLCIGACQAAGREGISPEPTESLQFDARGIERIAIHALEVVPRVRGVELDGQASRSGDIEQDVAWLGRSLERDLVDACEEAGLAMMPMDDGARDRIDERLSKGRLDPAFFRGLRLGSSSDLDGILVGELHVDLERVVEEESSSRLNPANGQLVYELQCTTVWTGRLTLSLALHGVEEQRLIWFEPDLAIGPIRNVLPDRLQQQLEARYFTRPDEPFERAFLEDLQSAMQRVLVGQIVGSEATVEIPVLTGRRRVVVFGLGHMFRFPGVEGFDAGLRYLRRGQPREALGEYQAAMANLRPDTGSPLLRARAYHNLGTAQLATGAYDDALRSLEHAQVEVDLEETRQVLEICHAVRGTNEP